MLTIAAASLLVGVAAILLPNSVVVLALGGLVARGLYGLILGGEYVEDEDQNRCFECGDEWPCPTIRALGGAES